MNVEDREKHTPHHAPGFIDRLNSTFASAGIRPREYVSSIMNATGLSKSGARLIIESQRPPKQLDTFEKLIIFLSEELRRSRRNVSKDTLAEYLLEGKNNPFDTEDDDLSISKFVEEDPVLASKLILQIEKIMHATQKDQDSIIEKEKINLIYYRIINYAFKNKADPESEAVNKNIESLLILARSNLL